MRLVALTVIALSLVACATAPQPPSSAPGGDRSDALKLCPGSVANAPAVDNSARVQGFDPIAQIGGVYLLRAPVDGCVSSGFGPRRGGAGSFHHGVDLFTRTPRTIVAGGDGVVEFMGSQRGYGRTIVIRHNARVKTRYAHLSSYAPKLREGARVARGEPIGRTGDTGNATAVHLHYEFIIRGRSVDPLTAGD